jgi:basic amino acid/polyamine antiporter, APA family
VTGKAERPIGVVGAVFTLVGFVIGASIYILPGQLYQVAGPALTLAFAIGAVPALLSCLVATQIGCAFPSAGANMVATRALLGPIWGFLVGWLFIGASVVALALLAHGFAHYSVAMFPGIAGMEQALAAGVVLLFGILNCFGVRETVMLQSILVVGKIGLLVILAAFALGNLEIGHFTPFAPHGWSGIGQAVVPAFFAFLGFTLIVNIAEEMDDPGRAIPKVLGWGFAIILILYLAVVIGIVGVVPGAQLAGDGAAVDTAANLVLPPPLAIAVGYSALLAAATSINGLLLVVSRDILALARSGVLPAALTATYGSNANPRAAVAAITLAAMLCTFVGAGIESYAVTTVLGFMAAQAIIALAAAKMPGYFGERYGSLPFVLPPMWLKPVVFVLLVSVILFSGLSLLSDWTPLAATAAFIGAGILLYWARSSARQKTSFNTSTHP